MEELAPLTAQQLDALPLFPLRRLVFFPGTVLPLHIFEARYKAMLHYCLNESASALALGMLREDGTVAEDASHPAVHSVAGVGRISEWQELPNGNFAVLLQGVMRVNVERELETSHPFRLVKATPRPDVSDGSAGDDLQSKLALVNCASHIVATIQREHADFSLDINVNMPAGYLADLVADRLVSDAEVRQRLLEQACPTTRLLETLSCASELLALLNRGRSATSDPPCLAN